MPSSRPRERFQDIIDNISAIERYTAGMDFAAFVADGKTRDAVERCLSRISEAAVKLDALAEELAPGEPWANIRGYGNRLRHAYDGVDPAEVKAIIDNHLASLEAACRRALEQLDRRT